MKNLVLVLIFLATMSCVHRSPIDSKLQTEETKKVLLDMCKFYEADVGYQEWMLDICNCLDEKMSPYFKKLCQNGKLNRNFAHLREKIILESTNSFKTANEKTLTKRSNECRAQLTDFHLDLYGERLFNACKKGSELTQKNLYNLPLRSSNESCWVYTRITKNACVSASPCRGQSHTKYLPLAASDHKWVSENTEIELCHPNMVKIHKMKDRDNLNIDYNYAYANYLAHGRSAPAVSFGPANCHGTAQALVGDFLMSLKVTGLSYHSVSLSETCRENSENIYRQAQILEGQEVPKARHFPINEGGFLVNMNHDPTCNSDDIGKIQFATDSCDKENPRYHIFAEGMCINAWDRLLQEHGMKRFKTEERWQNLKSGCVLTTRDHSVAFIGQSDGMCYFYEATTPYGPPFLRVYPCNVLLDRFEKRWCPRQPMVFQLK